MKNNPITLENYRREIAHIKSLNELTAITSQFLCDKLEIESPNFEDFVLIDQINQVFKEHETNSKKQGHFIIINVLGGGILPCVASE